MEVAWQGTRVAGPALCRIAVVHSNPRYLINMRLPLMTEMVRRGHAVFGMAPGLSADHQEILRKIGVTGVDFSQSPTGLNLFRDLLDTVRLSRIFKRLLVDVVFTNTAKSVIYGSVAARLADVPHRSALVSGLGYVYPGGGSHLSWKRKLIGMGVRRMYKVALALNEVVFFHNREDIDDLVRAGLLDRRRAVVVNGSGVPLDEYRPAAAPPSVCTFVYVGRFLGEKGVREYIAAARLVKAEAPKTRVLLVGARDPNPDALPQAEIDAAVREDVVEWPGSVADVKPWLHQASVFVLPSYYREGLPRSILEAMACGLPIITTDWIGCRETVVDGRNGFLVPIRDVDALAHAMRRFIEEPALVAKMGGESRRIAEDRFDARKVSSAMLDAIGL